jgi:hypothetical protein
MKHVTIYYLVRERGLLFTVQPYCSAVAPELSHR